jgi:hypothetical protein
MSIRITIDVASPRSIDALARFLRELEAAYPCAARDAHVTADGGIIYVGAEFHSDEENLEAGDEMAKISTQLQAETEILVVLSPSTREKRAKAAA